MKLENRGNYRIISLVKKILILFVVLIGVICLVYVGELSPISDQFICFIVTTSKNLRPVKDCQVSRYSDGLRILPVVSVSYGVGMDCPAGCIYSRYTGIVDGIRIIDIPEYNEENLNYQLLTFVGSTCSKKIPHAITLSPAFLKYKWKISFNSEKSTICPLSGEILIDEEGKYDFSKLKKDILQFNCQDNQFAEQVCKNGRLLRESNCESSESTKNTCLYFQAEATKQLKPCDQIINNPDLVDGCYYTVAIGLKDWSICANRHWLSSMASYYLQNCEGIILK